MNTTIEINNKNIFTTKVFSKTLYKTNYSNKKGNQVLLGIDILKEDVRKELLLIAVSQLEKLYEKLLSNPKYENVLRKKGKLLFLECIKNVCEDFLTKKYGYKVRINLTSLKNSLYVKNLLKDTDILFKVQFFSLMDQN